MPHAKGTMTNQTLDAKPLALVTRDAYAAVCRSRAKRDELLAKRHGLPLEVVSAIRAGVSLREAVAMCVHPGMRVRLDTPMNSCYTREPQLGEWGTVSRYATDDGGKVWVDWDNGSNLAIIPDKDSISYLP